MELVIGYTEESLDSMGLIGIFTLMFPNAERVNQYLNKKFPARREWLTKISVEERDYKLFESYTLALKIILRYIIKIAWV